MQQILREKIALLEQQRDQHCALMNQAIGAIALAQHLLEQKDALSIEELEQMVGGKVEAIEAIDDHKNAA
jgi:hypothetical protein